jgi:hypothetical protein
MNKIKHNICSLSRSGTHAIIYWIIHNLVDSVDHIGRGIYIDKKSKLCYLNNINIQDKNLKESFPIQGFQYVFYSYEDNPFNKNTSIIILRDILNLICSRYKKWSGHKHNICVNNNFICDAHYLIEVWKQHTKGLNKIILYNQWLVSKQYRDQISLNVAKIENSKDRIDYISDIGEGSSFDPIQTINNNDYLYRYNLVNLPDHIKKIILRDDELLELNKKIFDIDIKKILL